MRRLSGSATRYFARATSTPAPTPTPTPAGLPGQFGFSAAINSALIILLEDI